MLGVLVMAVGLLLTRPAQAQGGACMAVLKSDCPAHDATLCWACVVGHQSDLQKANCTNAEIHDYCGRDCTNLMNLTCPRPGLNDNSCQRCVQDNAARFLAVCLLADVQNYCIRPVGDCLQALSDDCGLYRGEGGPCESCVAKHHADVAKANCTEDNCHYFCEDDALKKL